MGKIVRAGARAGARTFDKPEPELEPDKMDRLRNIASNCKQKLFSNFMQAIKMSEIEFFVLFSTFSIFDNNPCFNCFAAILFLRYYER
jgi:hypothetical protein